VGRRSRLDMNEEAGGSWMEGLMRGWTGCMVWHCMALHCICMHVRRNEICTGWDGMECNGDNWDGMITAPTFFFPLLKDEILASLDLYALDHPLGVGISFW
jgi:hypothetical protein